MKITYYILLFVFLISCSKSDTNLITDQIDDQNQNLTLNLGISFPPVSDEEQRIFTASLLDELNSYHTHRRKLVF